MTSIWVALGDNVFNLLFVSTTSTCVHTESRELLQDTQYIWNSEDLAVVSVSPRSCKACAFYEDRKFPLKKVSWQVQCLMV